MNIKNKIKTLILAMIMVFSILPFSSVLADDIEVNNTYLTRAINACYSDYSSRTTLNNVEADYTTASWSSYATALSTAYDVESNETALQTAVDDATAALILAKSNLVFAGQADLDAALAIANGLNSEDYTNSWNTLLQALALPDATNEQIVYKATELNDALDHLITIAAYNALDAAFDLYNSTYFGHSADYTIESWDALNDALNLIATTNDQYITKTTAINNAISGLVFAGQADLDAAVAAAGFLTSTNYTTGTWLALTDALALTETTNAEVIAKTTAINTAIGTLIFAATPDLITLYEILGDYTEADYTVASYNALTIAAAPSVLTSNDEVLAKIDAINDAISGLVFAGQADLDTAVAAVGLLTSTNYTTGTWETLELASDMPTTTNTEVLNKTAAINGAIVTLIFAGRADLDNAITAAGGYNFENYTISSYGDLTDALALPESNNTEIVAKTTAINNAISGLVFAGQADLDAAITAAGLKCYSCYTTGTWETLELALDMPTTTNAEVVAKTTAINNAMSALIYALTPDLEALYATLDHYVSADYTVASYNALTAAAAPFVPTSNSDVALKITAINDAISGLIFAGQADLDTAVAAVGLLTSTNYTTGTWETLELASDMPTTTNTEVLNKTAAINGAIVTLIFAGRADLDNAITAAGGYNSENYTISSYGDLTDALALPESNNTEIVAKTTAINNAISGLITIAASSALNEAEDAVSLLTDINYTVASWGALQTALALPETTNAEVLAKATAITNAISDLELYTNLTKLTALINAQHSDKSRRKTLIRISTDYTTTSWDNYIAGLAAAKLAESNLTILQTEVNLAIDTFKGVIADLVFAGQANLDLSVIDAAGYTAEVYTEASHQVLTDALALPETTNSLVLAKTVAINEAINSLIKKTDNNALIAALAIANGLTSTDYTSGTWETLELALDMPTTTNNEVISKTTAINNAVEALIYAATSDLTALYETLDNYTEADYTAASYSALITSAAPFVPTSNADVLAKIDAINNAISGLVFAGQADLDAAVAAADLLTSTDYTTDTWSALTDALSLSETTNAQVLNKTTAIYAAIGLLKFAGRDALDAAKLATEGYFEASHTATSYAVLTDALALPESNNAEIVAKTAAINSAIAGLITNVANDALTIAIIYSESKISTDYTTASWLVLTNALALDEDTNDQVWNKGVAITNAVDNLVFAGLADLNTASSIASGLISTHYTSSTWSTLTDALALDETTNAEIVAKTTAINNAIGSLVFIGQADLNTVLASASGLTKADYTTWSWSVLETALALPTTTNAQVVAKTTAINNAIGGLIFAGKANLDTAKDLLESLTPDDYTNETVAIVLEALALPETTNALIVTKTAALNAAITGLITKAANDALIVALGLDDELVSTDYTTTSWEILQTALALPELTNQNLLDKVTAINNAIAGLITKAANEALIIALELDDELTSTDYTTASWSTLTNALALPIATNTNVLDKITAINNAISGLVFAGQANLNTALTTVSGLTEANYTTASWLVLENALALPITTNAEVLAKTTAINTALGRLITNTAANALATAKASAATKVQSKYTTASWLVLTNALALPETTNAQVLAKTTAINNAITGLVTITPTIKVGTVITIKAGTKYWVDSASAKLGVGGYTLRYNLTTTITMVAANGCFNVTGYLGWFNPALLVL